MHPEILVEQITIKNFRNHTQYKLNNSEAIVVLNGDNGVGKTNILEAISLFSPGKGLRSSNQEDLINKKSTDGYFEIIISLKYKRLQRFMTRRQLLQWELKREALPY